ncbi:MAG: DNA topoisomerase (ATP-hydrolyzing) subunit A [Eubacteriales bacterium]|nr:DNA topoisomerase (ATP-hydrolyzing) subunit A [Eubacteriales bacterium]MDY5859982.1 DNA topoisomerase (ATP-hydrolyzing) subunit A [Eubacteriales bacterium]
MAKKKKITDEKIPGAEPAAPVTPQLITETIEENYMPYVMSVIVSRAIPEIDGFKPAHRKLLYTMYKMGLMTGPRTKSANVVGQTMRLNPHGDMAIYETLVRLTRGNAALLHPFIDSKGAFGKQYSTEMKFSAPRYTEVKLDKFTSEIFSGIDKNAVDLVDNYDGTMKEPVLLPTTFPNILVTPNMGIAVGMASNICSFNLAEICDGTIALLRNPKLDTEKLLDIIKAPDFPGGGQIIYNRDSMREVFETGSGSVRIRSKYKYDPKANCIDILEIPYSTTIEQIIKRLTELYKDNKLKEVTDFRDEIGLSGFKLTLDIRRGTDPDQLMAKLFKSSPLEDSFKCNFNVLIDSVPRQMGVREILNEWIKFRTECFSREIRFELDRMREKLHLLMGLGRILLDIDKAIRIIRGTEKEADVIPNLCKGFSIDEAQAEFIADIKLRYLNREYILNRIKDIDELQKKIAEHEATLADELKLKKLIAAQLTEIKKKYGQPRRSEIIHEHEITVVAPENDVENFPAHFFLTSEGYFKKITALSLRGNDEHKLKDGDKIICEAEADNLTDLFFFTDKAQLYRAKASDFDICKASAMGEFLPAKLGFDQGEKPIYMKVGAEWSEKKNFVFVFENGKGVKVPQSVYLTKGNRRKLTGAFSPSSPIKGFFEEDKPFDILIVTSNDRAAVLSSSLIPLKTTRTSIGSQLVTLRSDATVSTVMRDFTDKFENTKGYKKIKIPATPVLLVEKDIEKMQLKLDI